MSTVSHRGAKAVPSRGTCSLTLGLSRVRGRKRVWNESAMIWNGSQPSAVSSECPAARRETMRQMETYDGLQDVLSLFAISGGLLALGGGGFGDLARHIPGGVVAHKVDYDMDFLDCPFDRCDDDSVNWAIKLRDGLGFFGGATRCAAKGPTPGSHTTSTFTSSTRSWGLNTSNT